ncbi:MAG: hypothetical protein R2795_18945 [Saprospiraceae bacterium]
MTEEQDFYYNDEYYQTIEIVVDPGQDPLRIDKFLHTRLQSSRNRIQDAIRTGSYFGG